MAWTQWVITVLMDLSTISNKTFDSNLIEKNACSRARIGRRAGSAMLGRPGRSGQVVVDMRLSIGVDTFSFSVHGAVGGLTSSSSLPSADYSQA